MKASAHWLAFVWLLTPWIGLEVPRGALLSNCMSPLRAKSPTLCDHARQHTTRHRSPVNTARYELVNSYRHSSWLYSGMALELFQQQW